MNLKRIEALTTEISSHPWFHYGLLSLITLFGAALRFYELGTWSFWIDEIYTINHATAHFSTPELIVDHIPPARNWVPISVISAAQALNIWGTNEWSARLASVFIGIVSIPILYLAIQRMFGERVAVVAALLLAVSPWHVFWSQNARFYTSLMLFYSLAGIVFYFGLERNKPSYFFVCGVLFYLAVSERLTALFLLPVIAVYIVALWMFRFEKPPGLTPRNLLILGVPVFGGILVEASSWVVASESRFFGDFNWFFQYRSADPIRLLANIGFSIGVPLMVLALFSALVMIFRKDRAGLWTAVNIVVPLVTIVAANPFIFTKDRYVFMSLFSWIVLAAIGLHELYKQSNGTVKWIVVGVLALLLADAASDSLLYYRFNNGNRPDWRAAFSMIERQSQPDDIVVTYWPEVGSYYIDREFIQYEDIDVATMLNSEHEYWFVLDQETVFANEDVKDLLETEGQLIDIRYLRRPDGFYLRIYRFPAEQAATE